MSTVDRDAIEFRAHLIEVGRDAMGRNDGWRWWHPRHLARLLDFWEPLIRADERRKVAEEIAGAIEERADDFGWDEACAIFNNDDVGDVRDILKDIVHGAAAIARSIGGAS